jgi:hypothetical protein
VSQSVQNAANELVRLRPSQNVIERVMEEEFDEPKDD